MTVNVSRLSELTARTFFVVVRCCWIVALLYIPYTVGVWMWLVFPGMYDRIVWEVAIPLCAALTLLLPLTASWVWFRNVDRSSHVSWPVRANAYVIDLMLPYVGPVVTLFSIPVGFRIRGVEPFNFYFYWNPDNLWPFLMVFGSGMALTVCFITLWFALSSRGQTPGKYLLKIRVVDSDSGEPLHRRRMFVREFVLKFLLMGFHSGIQVVVGMAFWIQTGGLFHEIGTPALFIWRACLMVLGFFWRGHLLAFIAFAPIVVFLLDGMWGLIEKRRQTLHDRIVGSRVVHF